MVAGSTGRLETHRRPPIDRKAALLAVVGLTAAGLLLRLGPWHLPLPVHHTGGGLLWGAMIYALVSVALPARKFANRIALATAIIVAVEGSRLLHAPWLALFRRTMPGQLLLGHIFSSTNIVVDGAGAAMSAAILGYCSWYGVRPPPRKP